MDIGPSCYTSDEYRDCLTQLGRVGRLLGGDRASFWAFDRLSPPPGSILDVGCGGGHFAVNLAKRFPQARVVGTDISSDAITEKKELESAPNSFDVVTATMVCHHMKDEEIVDFFKRATAVASRAVIINDLHRHPLAWISYALVGPVLFHNRLITHDGLPRPAGIKRDDLDMFLEMGLPMDRIH
jgi:SAM-dependent methyltransferase